MATRNRSLTLAPRCATLAVAVLLALTQAAFAQVLPYYHATKLPALPASWVQGWTLGVSLNDASQVAGVTQMGMAVGWSFADGLVPLSGDGQAVGVAAGSGAMVGWSRGDNGRAQAAMWSFPGGGTSFLSNLYGGVPAYESRAHAVNDNGWVLITGRATIDDTERLMLLRPGQTALDFGDSATGYFWQGGAANGIVAGNVRVPGNATRGVVWTEAGGFRSFSVNGGDTFIEGVNANGWVVGRTHLQDAEGITYAQGFVHDATADQTLFGWMNFWPRDVNNSGLVVGNLVGTGTQQGLSAAAWASGAVVDLNTRTANLGFYELYQAIGVNSQGQILAFGGPTKPGAGQPPPGTPALATFLLSECVRCGQIKPNPNPIGTLLDVAPDWFDAFNEQDYRNLGTLQIGTLAVNLAGAVLRNAGTLDIYGGGVLLNHGQLVNEASGHLNVTASMQRSADSGAWNAGFVTIGAVGQMHDDVGASWLDEPGSTFIQNGGTVTLAGYWGADRSTWEQRGGLFTTLPGSFLEMLSATATVDGTLTVRGRLDLLPNLAATPNRRTTLQVTGTLVVDAGGELRSTKSSIDVAGGQFVNAGGALELGHNSMTWVRAGGAMRLEAGATHNFLGSEIIVDGASSSLTVLAGATLRNSSWLTLMNGAELVSGGTVTNALGGTLVVDDGSAARSHGTFFNEGFVQVTGSTAMLEIGPPASPGNRFVNLGTVGIADGALLRVAGAMDNYGAIAVSSGSRVLVEGGTLWIGPQGSITGGGEFVQQSGATFVHGLIDMPAVYFWGGTVGGTGTIRSSSVVFGMGVAHADTLRVQAGSSPGTLTIDGDLTINNALMEIEIGDFRRHDRLVVTGNLQIGQFAAVLMPETGYVPDLNDRFDWLSAGSVSGDLSSVTLDASALGGGWIAQAGAGGLGSRITLGHVAATAWGPDVVAPGTSFVVAAGAITEIAPIVSSRYVFSDGDVEVHGAVAVRNDAGLGIRGGTFRVAAGGRLTSRGWVYHDVGLLNEGLVRNYEDGSVSALGRFTNRGTVENAGFWDPMGGLENEAGGRVINHGTIWNRGAGIVNRGRFEHHGVIENEGFITNTQSGTFIVAAGAEVRSAGSGFDKYFDFGGVTQVDGRLAASEIRFQGGIVRGGGTLVGPVRGDALFELGPAGNLAIEGDFVGSPQFDVWINAADAYGHLTVSGNVTLQGGMLRFLLTEGGYMPQAGDRFRWLRAGGTAGGLDALVWRVDVRVPGEFGYDYPWAASDLVLTFSGDALTVTAVPEPQTWITLLAGLALVGLARRRARA